MTKKGKSSFSLSLFSFFFFYKRSQIVFFINSSPSNVLCEWKKFTSFYLPSFATPPPLNRVFVFLILQFFLASKYLIITWLWRVFFSYTINFILQLSSILSILLTANTGLLEKKKVVTRPTYIDREHLIFTTRSRSFSRGENRGGGRDIWHLLPRFWKEGKISSFSFLLFSSVRFEPRISISMR